MFRKNVHFVIKNSLHNCYFCISTKNHVNPTMRAGHRTRVLGASETQKKIRFGGWCVIEIFAVKLNANELPPSTCSSNSVFEETDDLPHGQSTLHCTALDLPSPPTLTGPFAYTLRTQIQSSFRLKNDAFPHRGIKRSHN